MERCTGHAVRVMGCDRETSVAFANLHTMNCAADQRPSKAVGGMVAGEGVATPDQSDQARMRNACDSGVLDGPLVDGRCWRATPFALVEARKTLRARCGAFPHHHASVGPAVSCFELRDMGADPQSPVTGWCVKQKASEVPKYPATASMTVWPFAWLVTPRTVITAAASSGAGTR